MVVRGRHAAFFLQVVYRELAEHYGTAVIPARVRSPKDKAMVEGTVGVISTFILAALRNRRFLSLNELNKAIFERLYEFNHKPFQKRDGSRATVFEEEKAKRLPRFSALSLMFPDGVTRLVTRFLPMPSAIGLFMILTAS